LNVLCNNILINLYYLYLSRFLLEFNVFYLLVGMVISGLIYYLSKIINFQVLMKNFSSIFIIRFILILSLLVSFFINCLVFWIFIKCYYSSIIFFLNSSQIYNSLDLFFYKIPLSSKFGLKFSIEFFGFVFILLAYIVGFISFLALDTRLFWKNNRFVFICNFLVFVIFMFVIVNDVLLLFLFY